MAIVADGVPASHDDRFRVGASVLCLVDETFGEHPVEHHAPTTHRGVGVSIRTEALG
jgi:hypothetical protein